MCKLVFQTRSKVTVYGVASTHVFPMFQPFEANIFKILMRKLIESCPFSGFGLIQILRLCNVSIARGFCQLLHRSENLSLTNC